MKSKRFLRRFALSFLKFLAIATLWIIIWSIAARLIGKELLLPSPLSVLKRLGSLLKTSDFYITAAVSMIRVLLGIVTATLVGVLLAVLTKVSRLFDAITAPLVTVIKATPVASFIILALVWLDRSVLPIFISFLIVLPVVHTNVKTGIYEVDPKLLEMASAFKIGKLRTITKIYVPSVLPYFSSSVKSSLGLAWKSGVAAEVLAMPKMSIGKKLFESKAYLETTDLFAWTLVVILLSLIIEFVFKSLLTRFTVKKEVRKDA